MPKLPKLSGRWRWLLVLPALLLLWLLSGVLLPPKIIAAKPARGPAVEAVYATGTVESNVMLPIAARTTARLMTLNVDEGSHVRRGQVLARLEDEDLRGTLQAAQARAENARQVFARNAELLKASVVSRQEYERSETDLKTALADVERARAQVEFLTLRAPSTGDIIRRDGEIGELIPLNTPIFWLSADPIRRITAEVDEEDIFEVRRGQKVLIRADAFPDENFTGTVQSITPKGDTTARSYRVRVSLPQDTRLMIGMTAETNIILREKKNALLVPTSSISEGYVWLANAGRLKKQPVTVGARGPQRSEILKGVDENDLVVQTPPTELKEGARVRVRKPAES